MKYILIFLLFCSGCVAKSSFVDKLAQSNHETAGIIRAIAQAVNEIEPNSINHMNFIKAGIAETESGKIARQGSSIVPEGLGGQLLSGLFSFANLATGGVGMTAIGTTAMALFANMKKKKAQTETKETRQTALEVGAMNPEMAREILKAKKIS